MVTYVEMRKLIINAESDYAKQIDKGVSRLVKVHNDRTNVHHFEGVGHGCTLASSAALLRCSFQ